MTCFRYDAILHFGAQTTDQSIGAKYDGRDFANIAELANQLANTTAKHVLFYNLLDARIQRESNALSLLASQGEALRNVADLETRMQAQPAAGIQPEAIYKLAEQQGWRVQTIGTAAGRYSALFSKPDAGTINGLNLVSDRQRSLEACCNNPLKGRIQRNLVPALKAHLSTTLPDYMIPGVFVILDAFPLTPNEKIDRKALPAPDQGSTQSYIEPRTETEVAVATIWENLLGLDQVGALDDFFTLGGHSLLATQLMSRIRDQLQLNLPLNTLFDNPTVASLAAAADTLRWAMANELPDSAADIEEFEI